MSHKVWRVKDGEGDERYVFLCPGCGYGHVYYVKHGKNSNPNLPTWTFNGDMERPSFTPSLLNYGDGVMRCHLYVTDGMIYFCSDCEHELSGKIVPMQEIV